MTRGNETLFSDLIYVHIHYKCSFQHTWSGTARQFDPVRQKVYDIFIYHKGIVKDHPVVTKTGLYIESNSYNPPFPSLRLWCLKTRERGENRLSAHFQWFKVE